MDWPMKILMIDSDGGVFSALLCDEKQLENIRINEEIDTDNIPVYKQKEYYHSLEDAIRDEF